MSPLSHAGPIRTRTRDRTLARRSSGSPCSVLAHLGCAVSTHQQLRREAVACGNKQVARLLGKRGLAGRSRRRFRRTAIGDPAANPQTPDLVRRTFGPEGLEPNRVWVGDISYLRTGEGWCYIATMIDLASRSVVGFALADHLRTSFACDAYGWPLRHDAPRPVSSSTRTVAASTPPRSSGGSSPARPSPSRSAARPVLGTPSRRASSPPSRPSWSPAIPGPPMPPSSSSWGLLQPPTPPRRPRVSFSRRVRGPAAHCRLSDLANLSVRSGPPQESPASTPQRPQKSSRGRNGRPPPADR